MTTFRPFGAPQVPLTNLERRAEFQRRAYQQSLDDLNEARQAQGLDPLDEQLEAPSPFLSDAHRFMQAADERRRRGLGPTEETGVIPTVSETARLIIAADRKARGLDQPDYFEGPPQTQLQKTSAEEILAAYRKANLGRK